MKLTCCIESTQAVRANPVFIFPLKHSIRNIKLGTLGETILHIHCNKPSSCFKWAYCVLMRNHLKDMFWVREGLSCHDFLKPFVATKEKYFPESVVFRSINYCTCRYLDDETTDHLGGMVCYDICQEWFHQVSAEALPKQNKNAFAQGRV